MDTPIFQQVLTIPEIAKILRISVDACYRLAKRGALPCCRVGGSWRCTPEMLNRYLAGEWTPPSPKPRRGRKRTDYSTRSFADLTGQVLH